MKYCKFLLFYVLTLGALNLSAQDATTASGGDASGSGGSNSFSVGQIAYTRESGTTGSSNQGVQQPYTVLITGMDNRPDINLSMKVFPNPSIDFIQLNLGKQDLKDLSFQLFDVQGKLLADQKIIQIETSIKMNEYSMGNYFLKVMNNTTELKTFRINKN